MSSVLVIGGGGREHAITWKLFQSEKVSKIYVSPGNAGISQQLGSKVEIVALDISKVKSVAEWCVKNGISLVVVGPEAPLADGIADALAGVNVKCFGPARVPAQIETDKAWSKRLMDRAGVPTARWKSFTNAEDAIAFIDSGEFSSGWVIKASGLAAGKGVVVALDRSEAVSTVKSFLVDKKFGSASENIIIEEVLVGEELSVLAFTDGRNVSPMLPAQDHKRALDGDKGGMTGGMGAYCPCSTFNFGGEDVRLLLDQVSEDIIKPVLEKLRADGTPFVGVLYAGLMATKDGLKVLEFNCRFGDPETEVLLPLLDSDLYTIMEACCTGRLDKVEIRWKEEMTAVTVVMASRGYPESSSKGDIIYGLDEVENRSDTLVFHCGTKKVGENVVTNGGRVLAVVVLASTLTDAAAKATLACSKIKFDGAHYRTDIAHRGIARQILSSGKGTYKASGVDITAGENLVERIKGSAKSTIRSGVCGGLGGFGALFDVRLAGYKDPLLVSGTDGVGTKLKIAQATGDDSTIGIDLVAMCANDILTHGAEPLFFLDYYACGKLRVDSAAIAVNGIAEGCRQAGCALVGGETAEMPGMYEGGDYDLAGFVVGAVEKDEVLPRTDDIRAGDMIVGLPSSGVHSNGYSLVRKIVADAGYQYSDTAPFSDLQRTIGEELLTPTKLYIKSVLPILKRRLAKALAHITGGGLTENIPRILKSHLRVELDAKTWNIPKLFAWLSATGRVSDAQMLRTFNCGLGMVIVCSPESAGEILDAIPEATTVGKVLDRLEGEDQVTVRNFSAVMEPMMRPYVHRVVSQAMKKKRVGVLISGSGTNLQALIDATANSSIAEIVLVISNKASAYGLERAKKAKIQTKVFDHSRYSQREAFEKEMDRALCEAGVDIVCLAGFMRVLTGWFVGRWSGRLLNLHPSLLPAFKGARAVKDALEAGVRVTGCTVHFVDESVDTGVIIAQEAVPILPSDTEDSLLARVHEAEHRLFPEALLNIASGKLKLDSSTNRLVG